MILSVIIPVYNEVTTIQNVLVNVNLTLLEKFESKHNDFELIIIDDCSNDNTQIAVEEFVKKYRGNINLIRNNINLGKGASILKGINNANGKYIIFQDGDLELDPKDINKVLDKLLLSYSFVNGNRFFNGNAKNYSIYAFGANLLFSKLASLLSGNNIGDLTCAYKGIETELIKSLDLKETRFGFEAELYMKASRTLNFKFSEVPVFFAPRNVKQGKKIQKRDALRIIYVIFKEGIKNSVSK